MERSRLASKTMIAGVASKLIGLVLGFASRTVFIYFLDSTLLGVNGLFSQVLTVLSFAELGFGTAMNFALYKPIANNDEELIAKLITYYRKVYRVIATIVAVVGLCIIPLLPFIIKGAEGYSFTQLIIFYCIFLFNSVITYFVSYKMSYVNACQKGFVITTFDTICMLFTSLMQIVAIVVFKQFMAYLLTQSIMLLITRSLIVVYINKKFPICKSNPSEKLDKSMRKDIMHNVKGLAVHRFSGVAVYATDNIIISAMISVILVGYVSNYNLIITNVVAFLTIIFSALSATYGNINATESKEFFYNKFKFVNFINFWLYGFCSIAFFVLIPPFITLWIGDEFLIDNISFALMILNIYLVGQSEMFGIVRDTVGNFDKDKWIALGQALVNLAISIVGAKYLGLVGIYIGTLVSRLLYIIFRPLSTFKMTFGRSSRSYYLSMLFYLALTLMACVVTYFATYYLLASNLSWWKFVVACLIVLVVPNIFFLASTFYTKEFKYTMSFLKSKLRRKRHV